MCGKGQTLAAAMGRKGRLKCLLPTLPTTAKVKSHDNTPENTGPLRAVTAVQAIFTA